MTREEIIKVLNKMKYPQKVNKNGFNISNVNIENEALEMAIKALENIGHLTDRPCDVCEFHKENGCCKWTCVFCDGLFGEMR